MKVNFPVVPKGGEKEVIDPMIKSSNQGFIDTPHKIYAGNLSWNLTSQGLIDVFSNQPGFLSAKVIYQRGSGRSRGFGFVTFGSAEEVESALNAMNGVDVEGRPIRLNLASRKLLLFLKVVPRISWRMLKLYQVPVFKRKMKMHMEFGLLNDKSNRETGSKTMFHFCIGFQIWKQRQKQLSNT